MLFFCLSTVSCVMSITNILLLVMAFACMFKIGLRDLLIPQDVSRAMDKKQKDIYLYIVMSFRKILINPYTINLSITVILAALSVIFAKSKIAFVLLIALICVLVLMNIILEAVRTDIRNEHKDVKINKIKRENEAIDIIEAKKSEYIIPIKNLGFIVNNDNGDSEYYVFRRFALRYYKKHEDEMKTILNLDY